MHVRCIALAVFVVACGGAVPSTLLDGSTGDDAQTADAQPDVPQSASCPTDAGACSAPDVPAGWAPVAFAADRKLPCPNDYGTAVDVVADPVVGTNACSCSCTKTQDPDCQTGTSYWSGVGSACTGFSPYPLMFSGGKCRPTGGTVDDYDKATSIAPTGGTCTVASVPNSAAITGTPARVCAANATCAPATCGGFAPAGFAACIASDGDVACPTSSPFSVKHDVAQNPAIQCSDCGSACTFEGSCTNPQMTFYSNQTCTTLIVAIPADSTCDVTGHTNAAIGGITYTATASFTGCTATGTSTGTLDKTGVRTVCCRP
jgi:hypothetical protein